MNLRLMACGLKEVLKMCVGYNEGAGVNKGMALDEFCRPNAFIHNTTDTFSNVIHDSKY